MADVVVRGAEQFRALGRDLKAAGAEGRGLKNELLAGLRLAGQPVAEAAKQSARDNLPQKGGLNEWVARSNITVRNNLKGSRAGIRIVATRKGGAKGYHDIEATDTGRFRHPVFGNRAVWVPQDVTPGWFTKSVKHHSHAFQAAALTAMDITNRRIAKGA